MYLSILISSLVIGNNKPAGVKEIRSRLDNTKRNSNGKAIVIAIAHVETSSSLAANSLCFERRTVKIVHNYGKGLYV